MKADIEKNVDKQTVGRVGEDIACNFLERRGFDIVGRNYRKFIGEIDIIAKKDKVLHFVEVKTVSRVSIGHVQDNSGYRAEDNIHPQKLKRLSRAINSYLSEKTGDVDCDWQCDAVIVNLFVDIKKAKVKYLENIFA
jgi:putative endonuclease